MPGIPARDLSAEEVEWFGGPEAIARSGLWELVSEDVGAGDTPAVQEVSDG